MTPDDLILQWIIGGAIGVVLYFVLSAGVRANAVRRASTAIREATWNCDFPGCGFHIAQSYAGEGDAVVKEVQRAAKEHYARHRQAIS